MSGKQLIVTCEYGAEALDVEAMILRSFLRFVRREIGASPGGDDGWEN